ncbi:MAG: carbamoyltransferase HypF [Thiogranum sp.]|nr:carbamoyltransferase HypF [Thiogranum sp.]
MKPATESALRAQSNPVHEHPAPIPGLAGAVEDSASGVTTRRWLVSGVVQGVGFRPFVYRLARDHGLRGWVRNCTGQVEIVASGGEPQLQAFGNDLVTRAPAISRPQVQRMEAVPDTGFEDFSILDSETTGTSDIHVPVDYFVCEDCLRELNDPGDRRYRYPFINCTQCGPRYTLIGALPYDRPNTSMAGFALCPDCLREYRDPGHRRFHAEPIACPVCGPGLLLRRGAVELRDTEQALAGCVQALRDGLVVAVKGVGGYHLMCDAANRASVQRLRERKPRPHKPLALLFPDRDDLALLRSLVRLDAGDEQRLRSPERPIVLLATHAFAEAIAPGLAEVGVMLPYSPLHHILIHDFGAPLVATSANISGEPVLTDADMVEQRLSGVAEAFLHHDRPIVRPADDPVYRNINGKPRPLRLGRGSAPAEFRLPVAVAQPVLAVGGHMKNTVCLAWGDRAVLSPHIGDMGTARSLQVFEQLAADLQRLYDVRVERLVCDRHPGYVTSRWARAQGLPVTQVQHHAAHASALIAEGGELDGSASLVFTWDGVGYGDDGTLWGGEALLGAPGNWQRVASMRPFRLPGADKAGREPWRSAVALAWETGADTCARSLIQRAVPDAGERDLAQLLQQAWRKSLNTPQSSAVGRLFDAAAAFTGVCLNASFEGQGPMWLETLATLAMEPVALDLRDGGDGILRTDWQLLAQAMMDDSRTVAERASLFHVSMAEALLQQALAVRAAHGVERVGLCGGVFQNRCLTEACVTRLQQHGFDVRLGERLPVNDAGISFGQVVEYASTRRVRYP